MFCSVMFATIPCYVFLLAYILLNLTSVTHTHSSLTPFSYHSFTLLTAGDISESPLKGAQLKLFKLERKLAEQRQVSDRS